MNQEQQQIQLAIQLELVKAKMIQDQMNKILNTGFTATNTTSNGI